MNELLRVSGFIGLGFVIMNAAKKLFVYVEMKKLSRTPAEELYEVYGSNKPAGPLEESGPWDES
ncbi:hypothetical protein D3C76_1729930 [compost metagenome]